MNKTFVLNPPFLISRGFALNWRFVLRIFWILGFISLITLSIFYIFQVNEMIRESYLIKNYEKKIEKLSQENDILEIKFSQSNSLESLEAKVQNLNYEKIGQVHYIQILDDTVVTK